jgi:hypothetical protein
MTVIFTNLDSANFSGQRGGVSWSAQQIPYGPILDFLDWRK